MRDFHRGRDNVGVIFFGKVFLYCEWWEIKQYPPRWGFEKWGGLCSYTLYLHRMLLSAHVFPERVTQ